MTNKYHLLAPELAETFVVQRTGIAATSAARASKKNHWDILFDKVWDAVTPGMVAEGFAGAAAGIILKEIMGPSKWEQEVTGKLNEIIGKLDIILSEIRALRLYIREESIASYRMQLQAEVASTISFMSDTMKSLEATENSDLRNRLKSLTTILNSTLGKLAESKDQVTGEWVGIPLYAALTSGLLMLSIAERVAGFPASATAQRLATFSQNFQTWSASLQKPLQDRRDRIFQQMDDLAQYNRRGALGVTFQPPEATRVLLTDSARNIAYLRLAGGVNEQFSYQFEFDPFVFSPDNEEWLAVLRNADRTGFPVPYHFSSDGLGNRGYGTGYSESMGMTILHMRAHRLVTDLNSRRGELVQLVEETERLESVDFAIKESFQRFTDLSAKLHALS